MLVKCRKENKAMKTTKKRLFTLLPLLAALVLALFAVQLSAQDGVVVPDIGFEIEGNTALDHGGDYDWETADYPPAVLIPDPNSKATTDSTTLRPDSKFDDPSTWSVLPGVVGPGQNELTNVLAWAILPGDLGNNQPDDFWLVLGMERTKKEGTFDLDFEFNQIAWDGTSGGPTRTPGDLVVGFELKGNPTDRQKDLQVLIVQYLPGAQPSLCVVTPGVGNEPALVGVGTEPCPPYGDSGFYYRFLADGAIMADSGLGQATMNEEPFPVPDGWSSTDSQGRPRSIIGPFQFAEAAINLTDLGVQADCSTFSTVHAKSRASLEVESDVKDLAGPVPLEVNCRIDGSKFLDLDANGLWDQPDEPPLEGWEITLSNGSVTFTDADGYYAFEDLEDGFYTVQEVCPDDWLQSAPGLTDFDACGDEVHTAELNINNREVTGLNFGNAKPHLDLVKACTADVFLCDDVEYTITVTNTGNVPLQDILVEDLLLDLSEMVDLLPGESKTFYSKFDTCSMDTNLGGGPYHVFLPLVFRGSGSSGARDQFLNDTLTNTSTATAQFAQVSLAASDDCVTTVHVPEVSKDAQTSFKRTYQWIIAKMVDNPGPITLLPGDSATPVYTVTVNLDTPQYVDSDWAVEGTITVANPAPMDAVLASVTDMVSPDIAATVNCPSLTVPAGGSLTCTYGPVQLPNEANRTNKATATLINNNGRTTDFSGSANVDFSQASMEEIDEEVQVFDAFWESPLDDLGTVRYDEVPATFSYTRTIPAPGSICELFEVPNEAFLVTNDTGTEIRDHANVRVQILELCTLSAANEDLPFGTPGFDWDYNDWVATIDISPTFQSALEGGDLLRMELTINPEAHGAAYNHEFWLRIPADAFECTGNYTRILFDEDGNTLEEVTGTFDPVADYDFRVIPSTRGAFPPGVTNTDESVPYVPALRTALLSIVFDHPCPFDLGEFDLEPLVHGEGLFFSTRLHVLDTGQDIGPGDPRTLFVPVDWRWPQEEINIWLAYPDVIPGDPPVFPIPWWQNYTDLIYKGKP
jgi:hypothetical protein